MEYKKISEFANVVTGGTPSTSKEEYWEGGTIPWLQSGCCQNCFVNEASSFITQLGYDNSVAKMMPKDTVMIALTGATAGKVGYLTFEACGNQSITGILPNKTVLSKFLYYYLQFKRPDILSDCVGGAQPHISQGYVKNILVPIYSIEEQKEIVGLLDNISGSISNLLRERSALDELIKSRFIEMFGDCKTKKPLEELTTKITDGSHNPPKGIEKSEFLMLSSQNVHNELDLTNVRYLTKEDFEVENKRTDVQKGDVLLTIVGTIGRTHVVKENEKYTFQRSVGVIKPKNNTLNGTFLSTYLHTEEAIDQLESGGHGSSQKGIYLKDVKKLLIPIPEYGKQLEFENFVELIDKSKFNIQEHIRLMEELLDKKMYEYFGGNE